MTERIPTGIEALDALIEGGVPKSTSGIILTDRTSPVRAFAQQILWNMLQQGKTCAYFHTRYASESEMLDEMAGNGWDTKPFVNNGKFRVSDYLALAELTSEEQNLAQYPSYEFSDAHKVEGRVISAAKLTKLTQEADYDFAIYDDLDLLLSRIEKRPFLNWAGTVAKLQKHEGRVALALVYQGTLPNDVARFVDRLGSDCAIELRTEETRDGMLSHFFRVTRVKATRIKKHGWIAYTKERGGLATV